MPEGLGIKTISDIYLEGHALAHASTRVKGDDLVNHCLDSRLERESQWSRKHSHIVQSESLYAIATHNQVSVSMPAVKESIKKSLKEITSEFWIHHVKDLSVQGRFLELIALEDNSTHWKSIIYDLPLNVCKFLINSVSDTLNHNRNLVRWGKKSNERCPACGNKDTLNHVFNSCPKYLEQGRYTWRHDNILGYLYTAVTEGLNTKNISHITKADLNDSDLYTTIPIECTVTNLKPDLTIFIPENKHLILIELSVPFELNIQQAHEYKQSKYESLINDIESNGFKVDYYPIEIGSRCYIKCDNKSSLKKIHKLAAINTPFSKFKKNVSKLAVISSFVIFHAKTQPTWIDPPPFKV